MNPINWEKEDEYLPAWSAREREAFQRCREVYLKCLRAPGGTVTEAKRAATIAFELFSYLENPKPRKPLLPSVIKGAKTGMILLGSVEVLAHLASLDLLFCLTALGFVAAPTFFYYQVKGVKWTPHLRKVVSLLHRHLSKSSEESAAEIPDTAQVP